MTPSYGKNISAMPPSLNNGDEAKRSGEVLTGLFKKFGNYFGNYTHRVNGEYGASACRF